MRKEKLTFNKPIYVGMSVLELSKLLMYDFHYNVMKPKYGINIDLCYMDTDSFIYEIETDDFYKDLKEMVDLFDTSEYGKNNIYGIPLINKKVLGKMKDENNGKIMTEFIGLRSKMYAFKVENKEKRNAKGITKCVVAKELKFNDYKETLFNNTKTFKDINLIRSHKHNVYTVAVNKLALDSLDDKRYILEDGISTLAWGHYKIE